jgi:hypothetical protein
MASWAWDATSRRYRNVDTGRYLSSSKSVELRDDFLAKQRDLVDTLSAALANGSMTLQAWQLEMRERIRLAFVTEYAFARGGRDRLSDDDKAEIGELVREQWGYLRNFAAEIATGKLSPAQAAARARLYMAAATRAHERGKASAWSIDLPAYPGDGTSECLVNCRCAWQIADTGEQIEATWHCFTDTESCATCVERSKQWAPLTFEKAADERMVRAA